MALLGNYSVINKTPGRSLSGSTVSDTRASCNKSGANRGRYSGWASWPALNAQPTGYRPPGAWVLAVKPGEMSSFTLNVSTSDLTALLAGGANGAVLSISTSDLTATGALVSSGAVTMVGTSTLAALLVGAAAAGVTMVGTSTFTATPGATGTLAVTMVGAGALTATALAPGFMAAHIDVTDTGDTLTAAQVASEVWSSPAASYTVTGSMGEALNVAQIMLRNKTVTDPTAGTITVYDLDGTTVLYVADLFADTAGTTPYAGAGAERRERLE